MGEKRFLVLDGMRGVAAFAVLISHIGGPLGALAPAGDLAVDFFFALSGFVLAHAYGASNLGLLGFLRVRAIRLYPLYLAGTVLGALVTALSGAPLLQLANSSALAVLFLPTPFTFSRPSWIQGCIYPLDPVAWSLLFEVIANATWFPLRRYLTGAKALVALFLCAALLIWTVRAYGSIIVGPEWPIFWGGFGRVAFSFLAGALGYGLWRRALWRTTLPAWIIFGGLALILVLPDSRGWLGALVVLLVVPPLVYLGACCELAASSGARACKVVGDSSYAVYTLHWPLLIVVGWIGRLLKAGGVAHPWVFLGPLAIGAVFAAALWLDRVYDRPVRSWLTRLGARPAPAAAAV